MASKKKSYKWTYLQNWDRLTHIHNELMIAMGEWWGVGGGRILRELASTVHMALFKINDQHGRAVDHTEFWLTSCGRIGGGLFWGEGMHIYGRLRTSRSTWKEHHNVNWLFSKTKKKLETTPNNLLLPSSPQDGHHQHVGKPGNLQRAWEKGTLFCLPWECQSVNTHCKEQQTSA